MEGAEGRLGSETGESWTGKKQKCIAARWPSTERLSRLRASIGETPNRPFMVYVCQPQLPFRNFCPVIYYFGNKRRDAYREEEIITLKNSNLKNREAL